MPPRSTVSPPPTLSPSSKKNMSQSYAPLLPVSIKNPVRLVNITRRRKWPNNTGVSRPAHPTVSPPSRSVMRINPSQEYMGQSYAPLLPIKTPVRLLNNNGRRERMSSYIYRTKPYGPPTRKQGRVKVIPRNITDNSKMTDLEKFKHYPYQMRGILNSNKDIAMEVLSERAILAYIMSTEQGSPQRQIINDMIKKYPELEKIIQYIQSINEGHIYTPRRKRGFFGVGWQKPIFGGSYKKLKCKTSKARRRQ